jgi:class 3 adenylate cyclase
LEPGAQANRSRICATAPRHQASTAPPPGTTKRRGQNGSSPARPSLVKTTGDGVLATFDGPGRGIRCAAALRDELAGLGLRIRAGLHTGEVELRDGDVGGIAVHLAARVMATAGPGEILISSTVRDLIAGSTIAVEDRGPHALKGVEGARQLFAVACA